MILEMSRSHIKLKVGDKTITIPGEAMMAKAGEPDFIIGRNEILSWDPPHENEKINEDMRQRIFKFAREELAKKKVVLAIE